jgi:hypothetical protein
MKKKVVASSGQENGQHGRTAPGVPGDYSDRDAEKLPLGLGILWSGEPQRNGDPNASDGKSVPPNRCDGRP